MSNSEEQQGVQPQQQNPAPGTSQGSIDKGKGKAVDRSQDVVMGDDDDDDDSSEEESAGEEAQEAEEENEEEEEGMEAIDTGNIIGGGRRTRGKNIDWAKAAEQIEDDDDDDEEDDGDFEDPDDSMQG